MLKLWFSCDWLAVKDTFFFPRYCKRCNRNRLVGQTNKRTLSSLNCQTDLGEKFKRIEETSSGARFNVPGGFQTICVIEKYEILRCPQVLECACCWKNKASINSCHIFKKNNIRWHRVWRKRTLKRSEGSKGTLKTASVYQALHYLIWFILVKLLKPQWFPRTQGNFLKILTLIWSTFTSLSYWQSCSFLCWPIS